MEAPDQACNGYWYNVNVKTPTYGPAWKCISQAEYDTVMAQNAHEDEVGGIAAIIFITVLIGGIGLAFLAGWIVKKLNTYPSRL